ncbi:MAG: serine/threonine-protein kinase, partial [Pseudomonadota bacterium]
MNWHGSSDVESARWTRLWEIFHEALDKPAAQRSGFLTAACEGDDALRAEIEELIASAEDDSTLLDTPVTDITPQQLQQASDPLVGDRIGVYRIRSAVGEGGMGVVYDANQEEPVKRRVALKLIKPGMDTREVIARFENERQALALMSHPNIAAVLDAGATPAGRPFFVMEYVAGIPITEYCDKHRLTLRERIELFMPVCDALQHAHQKGIIHRDIKPSNVLVAMQDGRPMPKVIDFGVAKALDRQLTE